MIIESRRSCRSLPLLLVLAVALAAPAWGQVTETVKLLPTDAAAADEFGFSVAVDAGVVVVGARLDDDNGPSSGSAYVFDAFTGQQVRKLLPDDGVDGDQFGFSVDIVGGMIAVGALRGDGNAADSGAVYVFDASTGIQVAKLVADDGATNDEFGFDVAIGSGVVAVGAKRDDDNGQDSGALYLFDPATGAQTSKLLPDDGDTNDNFGEAVGISGDIVAVGARGNWNGAQPAAGSAYLFELSSGDELSKMVASNAASWNFFGSAIDIDDGVVTVGAWARNVVFDHSGAAYLFDASDGSQTHYVVPADTYDRDHFGISVAIDSGIVVMGADGDDDVTFNAGSVYVYDATSGTQMAKLLSSDGGSWDGFGTAVAIGDGHVAVGAPDHDAIGADSGAVYVYDVGAPCAPATGLRIGIVEGTPDLHLTWSNTWDATEYRVYEDQQPDGDFTSLIGTTTSGAAGVTVPVGIGDRFYTVRAQSAGCP